MKTAYKGDSIELEERDGGGIDKSVEGERILTAIAGGDYWKKIIEDYRIDDSPGTAPSLKAEKVFSGEYRRTLSRAGGGLFRYVLDIPIRIKTGAHPKYRLVHATNHPDGCMEMANNMMRRAEELYTEVQSCGQQSLFDLDTNQNFTPSQSFLMTKLLDVLDNQAKRFFEQYPSMLKYSAEGHRQEPFVHLNKVFADFFCEHGVLCSTKDLVNALQQLARDNRIEVTRKPSRTDRGAESKFWTEGRGKSVCIRKKQE